MLTLYYHKGLSGLFKPTQPPYINRFYGVNVLLSGIRFRFNGVFTFFCAILNLLLHFSLKITIHKCNVNDLTVMSPILYWLNGIELTI